MPVATMPQELNDVIREHEDRYWTGQAIWTSLRARFPLAAREIEKECAAQSDESSDAVALIVGHLRQAPDILDRQWLHTGGPSIDEQSRCDHRVEIFRWRGEHDRCL